MEHERKQNEFIRDSSDLAEFDLFLHHTNKNNKKDI